MKIRSVLSILCLIAPLSVVAADKGIEASFVDDVIIQGTAGTKDDADLKVLGYSGFGTNYSGALMATAGVGSVYIQNCLEVGSNSWIMGRLGVGISQAPAVTVDASSTGVVFKGSVNSALTSNTLESLRLQHVTSGNMTTNFGVEVGFSVRDNSGVENRIGSLRATRQDADNSGQIDIITPLSGTEGSRVVIRPEGIVSMPNQSRARLYRAAAQSIPNNAWTKVLLDAKSFDSQAEFDSANNRLKVPVDGYYQVNAAAEFAPNNTGARGIALYTNGVPAAYGNLVLTAGNVLTTRVIVADLLPLKKNDYVELWVFQNRGGALNVNGGSTNSYMSFHKSS